MCSIKIMIGFKLKINLAFYLYYIHIHVITYHMPRFVNLLRHSYLIDPCDDKFNNKCDIKITIYHDLAEYSNFTHDRVLHTL